MNPKDVKSLIKLMRANGVTHLKADGVEITLAHEALFPKTASQAAPDNDQEKITAKPPWNGMSDEDIATWNFTAEGKQDA